MAIPVENPADYIAEVLDLCQRKKVETILYAHATVGLLHVRPALDMIKAEDIQLMKEISGVGIHIGKKIQGILVRRAW